MSFWQNSPGPTWSDSLWSFFVCDGFPHAFPIRREKLLFPRTRHAICIAHENDAESICQFLKEHFQITKLSICTLDPQQLKEGISKGWEVACALSEQKEIIGCIVYWPLGTCVFQQKEKFSSCANTGFMNFFCVHPDYRNNGLGSELLHFIVSYLSQKGKFVHFFQKEVSPLWMLPSIRSGRYIAREIQCLGVKNNDIVKWNPKLYFKEKKTYTKQFTISFVPQKISDITSLYKYDCGTYILYLAISKTFHKHRQTNGEIGEVLFIDYESEDPELVTKKNVAAGVEEILEQCMFSYIVMDEQIPHQDIRGWKKDASYYTYVYNMNPRHFGSVPVHFWF